MGVSPRTVALLRDMGHEAVRLSEVGLAEATDLEVISHAVRQGEVVLTFDLDYPALLALRRAGRASAVVFRTVNADPEWVNFRLADCLPLILRALEEGAIVVVEDHRIRIRRFAEL
jgi:predicted nuclease of predicted toxin-antitoxin system